MINLTINANDGNLYELTDRDGQPQASSAQIYRDDPYLTQSLIARLPIEPERWLRLLAQVGQRPADLHPHNNNIYQAVASAITRGDFVLYKLPLLNSTASLRGKNNTGLCIIKGPKPHNASGLSPESINSIEAAQALLQDLEIGNTPLIAYLEHHNLYNGNDQQNPLSDVLKRLASDELLAYKIPLPPITTVQKAVEYVAATSADKPVPLAPENNSPSASESPKTKEATPKPAQQNPPAQSIEECEQRLVDARERLIKNGYQSKYSDEQLLADAQKGELDDRFVARLIKNYAKDDDYLGRMDNGEVKYWSTTFNQMENADTDPKTLSLLFGIDYDPKGDYTLVVVDTQAKGAGQSTTIVPTHKNLGQFAKSEIKGINREAVDEVMTPEYNAEYAEHMAGFKAAKLDIDKEKDIGDYADAHFSSDSDKAAFKTRMKINKKLGANEHFTGNGTSKNLIADCPNQCGVMETFTYDKNPQTLANLESSGSAKRIPAKPLKDS
ncbi:MAG: hypothetical protein U5M23_09365 [Marinagarivorans sp.]|nr:hypothetical protein [Marinagarivorans sp.]